MPPPDARPSGGAPLISAIGALTLFGTVPVCVRAVGVGPYMLGIVRLSLAAAAITLIVWWQGKFRPREWPKPTWLAMIAIGLAFGLHWLGFFVSIKTAGASLGALGFCTYGTQLTMLGWLLGLSAFSLVEGAGVLLAAVGSLLIFPDYDLGNHITVGVLIGVASGSSYALLTILHQRNARIDGSLRTWAQFTFALPVFLVLSPVADWHIAREDWLLLLHLSLVVTLVGHALWIRSSTTLSTTTTSVLSYLYLPIAMLAGWLILDEQITGWMIAGAALIITGNLITLATQVLRGTMRATP